MVERPSRSLSADPLFYIIFMSKDIHKPLHLRLFSHQRPLGCIRVYSLEAYRGIECIWYTGKDERSNAEFQLFSHPFACDSWTPHKNQQHQTPQGHETSSSIALHSAAAPYLIP